LLEFGHVVRSMRPPTAQSRVEDFDEILLMYE
jgi:hypothetical protein